MACSKWAVTAARRFPSGGEVRQAINDPNLAGKEVASTAWSVGALAESERFRLSQESAVEATRKLAALLAAAREALVRRSAHGTSQM